MCPISGVLQLFDICLKAFEIKRLYLLGTWCANRVLPVSDPPLPAHETVIRKGCLLGQGTNRDVMAAADALHGCYHLSDPLIFF
jgi:hypothetical protein